MSTKGILRRTFSIAFPTDDDVSEPVCEPTTPIETKEPVAEPEKTDNDVSEPVCEPMTPIETKEPVAEPEKPDEIEIKEAPLLVPAPDVK